MTYLLKLNIALSLIANAAFALPGGKPTTPSSPSPAGWPSWAQCPKGKKEVVHSGDCNFDSLTPTVPLVSTSFVPVGYCDLLFQSWDIVQTNGILAGATGTVDQFGIAPHSPHNYARFNLVVTEEQAGVSEVASQFTSSNTTAFQPKSFYYGCSVDTMNGVIGSPFDCIITMTGYAKNSNTVSDSKQVCSHTFSYHATTSGIQQMAYSGDLSKICPAVSYLQFTYQAGQETATTPALAVLIDDFTADRYVCQ